MAVTITDNRGILNEADANTGWTGSQGVTAYTSPTPKELTNCLGIQVSNSTEDAYVGITSDDYSGGGTITVWMQANGDMDTIANGGIMIQVGDGTNRIGYHVGGSDAAGFRHETGQVRWDAFVLDLANKPANFTAFAGSEASLNEAAITQVGVGFKTLSKSVGGVDNCFWDIIRFADNGEGLTIAGGTTGDRGQMSEVAAADESNTSQQAYAVVHELAAGVFGIQGNIAIGGTGATDSYFEEANATYAWEDRGLSANNYYRFICQGGTGTHLISFDAVIMTVPAGASASFDCDDTSIDTFSMTGCTLNGFDQGVLLGGSTQVITNCIFSNNGQITEKGADLTGGAVSGYEGTAGTAALQHDVNADPDGELDDMTFTKGTAATHAIEFTANAPLTMTLRGIDFSGYTNTIGNNDAPLLFADRGSDVTWTVNLIDCSGITSSGYRKARAGDTVNIVVSPVTFTVTVENQAGTAISGARVMAEVTSAAGGFPYQDSISIVQTAGTATATHTGHGLSTNDWVVIRGATEEGYNGVHQITVTGVNTYTFTVDSGTSSPATGSPTATFVVIQGTTNGSGVISATYSYGANQPVRLRTRSASASPYYKPDVRTVTIDSTAGASQTVTLIADE